MLNVAKKATNRLLVLILFSGILVLGHNYLANITTFKLNTGISFGQNLPLIKIISLVLILILVIWYLKDGERGLLLILSGGLVNFIDRIKFNQVRDYWNLFNTGLYNNLNDWIIFLGIIIFLQQVLWKKSK